MPEPSQKPREVLVAVAHGSADPRASATIAELAAVARERSPGLDLRTAFLGHAPPSLPQVLSAVEADREVTVLPLLLTAAYHSKADIPRLLARLPRPRVSYGATLGPHPLLLCALERRLAEADPSAHENPARTAVVLAAAGSSDPEANATIARLAAQWQARTGWFAVQPAYASAAEPSPAAAVAACCGPGHREWRWPHTFSPRACSPTGSGSPRWPRGRPRSPRRSAPAPRSQTSCLIDSPRRDHIGARQRKSGA